MNALVVITVGGFITGLTGIAIALINGSSARTAAKHAEKASEQLKPSNGVRLSTLIEQTSETVEAVAGMAHETSKRIDRLAGIVDRTEVKLDDHIEDTAELVIHAKKEWGFPP